MARNQDPEAEAIDRYRERFDDSPPYWVLNGPNAVERLTRAIRRGQKIREDETERPVVQ